MSDHEAIQATKWALEAGYRGLDSAQMYDNEDDAGRGVNDFLASDANTEGLKRENIHYTTKLASNGKYNEAKESIRESVKSSGLGYVDLFLLHSPYGGSKRRKESWTAVEDAIDAGEVKMGGISNFGVKHVSQVLCTIADTIETMKLTVFIQVRELLESGLRHKPVVNQIEVHPFNTRQSIVKVCEENDIRIQAYAPLARSLRMDHPTISKLAKMYNCTPAQLMVRWSCQHGYIPLPKSVKKHRIVENANIGGFDISEDDMTAMDDLDEYLVTGKLMDADESFPYISANVIRLGSCRLPLKARQGRSVFGTLK